MAGHVLFWRKQRGNLWKLEVQTYKDRTFGNWRKWYADGDGWRPSREGCTMPLGDLKALTAALMEYHGLAVPAALKTDC
jgi:hypothetical protein